MTEKRFTIGVLKNYVNDNKTNYCYMLELPSEAKHLCNLLNQLSNENEQLKKILGISENDNVNDIVEVLNLQQTEIWKLQRGNVQLKSEIKALNDVLARYEEKELQK